MEVTAVPRQVRERLRHERRDHPVLLGERVHHVAEEDRAVARDERVVVGEVLLELAVRVLVVVRVVAPAELVAVARHRRQEVVVPREPGHVVAGLLERVVRVGDLDRAVLALPHEEVLELEAHPELEALLLRLREDAAEDRARAVRPLLPLDGDVAREAREVRLPGDGRVARRGRGSRRCRGRSAPVRSRRRRSRRSRRRPRGGRRTPRASRPARASRSAARTCRRTARTRTRLPRDCMSFQIASAVAIAMPPPLTSVP